MITNADIEKLKGTFATKGDLKRFATKEDLAETRNEIKEDIADVRVELGEMHDTMGTMAAAIVRIEHTLDGLAGAIQDQRIENGAGAVHLARHDRQIAALARATNVQLPE